MELVYIGLMNTSTLETMYLMDYDMTIGCKYQVSPGMQKLQELTVGEIYRNSLGPDVYILTNDKGKLITMSKDCFMSVEDFRDIKIDMIL
jgi:hypothetical protein